MSSARLLTGRLGDAVIRMFPTTSMVPDKSFKVSNGMSLRSAG
jgi:hypothetical protein